MKIDVDPRDVEAALRQYLASPGQDPSEAVAGAHRHGVLPLWNDLGGCTVLRPDGELLFFLWDAPDVIEPIADNERERAMVHVARARGFERFPRVHGLMPLRMSNSVVCPSCGGTGHLDGAPETVMCQCGGLGWIPGSTGTP